jgi:hypothetical protein
LSECMLICKNLIKFPFQYSSRGWWQICYWTFCRCWRNFGTTYLCNITTFWRGNVSWSSHNFDWVCIQKLGIYEARIRKVFEEKKSGGNQCKKAHSQRHFLPTRVLTSHWVFPLLISYSHI